MARRNLEADGRGHARGERCIDVEGLGGDADRRPTRCWTSSPSAVRARYRALVYDTAGFVDWFRAATPIDEIAELNIGSRPASRTPSHAHRGPAGDPLGVLVEPGPHHAAGLVRRRHGVRATGHGGDDDRLDALRARCTTRWPFFRTVVSNMAMVLAKSDLGIARALRRARARSATLRDRIFDRIVAEHERSVRWSLADHRPRDRCSPTTPTLARSMRNRFPYLDPLHHLQVELLRRWRAGDHDELVQRGIQLTINGLATALRNSG